MKLFILFLIFSSYSSMNIEVLVSKLEIQEILKAYLMKISIQNLSIQINQEMSLVFGNLLTKNLAISDLTFNEDLIKIDLIQDPKSMKVFIWLDSFALKLDVDIDTKVGLHYQTQLNLEVQGLQLEATLLLQKNQISLQNEKLDNFSIKSMRLKQGAGQIEKIIKGALNQLINLFKNLMNQKCANQIIQFFKQEKWKKLVPSYISQIKELEVMDSENLQLKFSLDNSEIISKISSIRSIQDFD
ncbi:unnamed protein product [Paramecium pentaurelia]|uniref:Lipid-binding serum glycoprotein N-terminal domain-containing protein n=1 Tax=Paramecium pentaurelia TaxID=43138 RepID=A0A8S1W7J9_9CILI|nr:unnamed protein product [Paramecium pentaurelia]